LFPSVILFVCDFLFGFPIAQMKAEPQKATFKEEHKKMAKNSGKKLVPAKKVEKKQTLTIAGHGIK
jgi:hypothetical protein